MTCRGLALAMLGFGLLACTRTEATRAQQSAQAAAPGPIEARPRSPDSPPEAPDGDPVVVTSPPAPSPTPPLPGPVAEVLALDEGVSTSVGSPIEGHLQGAVALPTEGPGFRHNPHKRPEARHGTVELVQALIRASAVVDNALPGGRLTINDLSLPEGGDISGHATHRSGRDVDILFYLLDEHGKPRPSKGIPLDPAGEGTDYRDLEVADDDEPVQLDVPRTWAFFAALVTDPKAHVHRIMIVEHLRTLLLDHARKISAPAQAIERFAAVTCQPNFPHDDHAHIRVFCSAQDIAAGCEDTRPLYPWHLQELAKHGVRPTIAGPRQGPRPKLTSHAEARAKAGPMHQDVVDFLERRKAWLKKPHPGRPYCR